MRLTDKNKDSIEKLHLLSGETKGTLQSVFQNLVVLLALNYLEGDATNIPFLGDIKITHERDEAVNGKAKAVLKVDIKADDSIIRLIGNIKDNEETSVEQLIKAKIRNELSDKLQL